MRHFPLILTVTILAGGLVGGTIMLRAQGTSSPAVVTLTVGEPSNIDRTNETVTSGVPMPAGTTATNWALFDGATEIPVQTTILPGLKTPWLLLDFQPGLTAGQTKTWQLRRQAPTVTPDQPVQVTEDSSQITVTTGPLKAQISTTAFNLFDGVWLDRNADGIFSDPGERVVQSTSGSNLEVTDASTGTVYSGKGNSSSITWEDSGSIRRTLKIEGTYQNGATTFIGYTTRISFFAGQPSVRVEHVLRNSVQANERPVKITTARVKVGDAGSVLTSTGINSRLYGTVDGAGTQLELVPATFTLVSAIDEIGNRTTATVTTATNGGFIIGDLSYHGSTATFDFTENVPEFEAISRSIAAKSPLIAVAPNAWYGDHGAFGAPEAATYQDEQDAYTRWGWAWNTTAFNQPYESHIAHMPNYGVDHASVQGSPADPEDDALWQDIFLLARTGLRGNFDRALGWAEYSKWQYAYRTDGFAYDWRTAAHPNTPGSSNTRPLITIPNGTRTATDDLYLANNIARGKMSNSHIWTGGLIDWYYLTGDRDALAASIDHAEVSSAYFTIQTPGQYDVGENIRAPSRNLMVGLRVWEATQDPQWKTFVQHMAALFLTDSTRGTGWAWWDEAKGMYYTYAVDYNQNGGRDIGDGKFQTVWMAGITAEAFYRYYRLTEGETDPIVVNNRNLLAHRLLKMAQFFRDYTPDPSSRYTQEFVHWDWPNPGDFSYPTRVETYALAGLPPVTYVFTPLGGYATIDALTIGYRLSGDPSFLLAAKGQWDKASKRQYDHNNLADPSELIAGPNEVGKFSGNFPGNAQSALHLDYELMYVHFFFHDAARYDGDPPATILDLRAQ